MANTFGLSVAQINELGRATEVSSGERETVIDANTGAVEGAADAEEPVLTDPVTEMPVETPPVEETPTEPVVAKEEDEDDSIDQDSLKKKVGTRIRMAPKDEKEAEVLLLVKRNKDMTLPEAYEKVYGKKGEPTETTPETPAVDPVAAIDTQLVAKKAELTAAKEAYDDETADKIRDEIDALKDSKYELKAEQREKALIARLTPVPAAVEPAPQVDAVLNADWDSTLKEYPEASDPKGPLMTEMKAIQARYIAANDPIIDSPRLNSVIAAEAAKNLKIAPAWARPAGAAKTPALVTPGPAKAAQRSDVTVPPVNTRDLAKKFNPLTLSAAIHGGY